MMKKTDNQFRSKLIVMGMVLGLLISPTWGQIQNEQTITKTGTTIAKFLNIGVDARGAAMGNAFVAMSGDVSSAFWNPAGLTHVNGIESIFVSSDWLAGTQYSYIGLGMRLGNLGVMGLSVTSLNIPEDKVRTVTQPEGTGEMWDASDIAVNLSFARQLTDKFSLGGNVKYIQNNIWHNTATGMAVDIGALFITPFNGIRLGAAITNYGTDMRLEGRDQKLSIDPDPENQGNVEFVNGLYETDYFSLPLLFRVGISGDAIQTGRLRLSYGVDAMHPNDNTEAVNAGLELAYSDMFFLRGGHANLFREDAEEGLTLGGGIHTRLWSSSTVLKIDYAYTDFNRLEGVQRLSLGVKF